MTADPYRASGGAEDPQSWNRYSYVQGDPLNFSDPSGLLAEAEWGIPGGVPGFWEPAIGGFLGSGITSTTQTHSQRVQAAVTGLGSAISGWEYANSQGTTIRLFLTDDQYRYMTAGGFQAQVAIRVAEQIAEKFEPWAVTISLAATELWREVREAAKGFRCLLPGPGARSRGHLASSPMEVRPVRGRAAMRRRSPRLLCSPRDCRDQDGSVLPDRWRIAK
jgi:hypothetical protein